MISGFFGQVSFPRGVWTLDGVFARLGAPVLFGPFFQRVASGGASVPSSRALVSLRGDLRFPCRPLTWASSLASRFDAGDDAFPHGGFGFGGGFRHSCALAWYL